MFNSYIELILSLVVIFALLSTLVSLLNELYRSVIRDRGRMLFQYIQKMFRDENNIDLAYLTFRHPLIDNARKDESNRPSYIEPKLFATAFIQTVGDLSVTIAYERKDNKVIIKNEERVAEPLDRFIAGVKTMHRTPLQQTLLGMAERAKLEGVKAYENLENQITDWFNNQMQSLSINYKLKQRKSLLFFALVTSIFLNIDSLHLVHELRHDPQLRVQISNRANEVELKLHSVVDEMEKNADFKTMTDTPISIKSFKNTLGQIKSVNEDVKALELPIGYSKTSAPVSWFFKQPQITEFNYYSKRNSPRFLSIVFYIFGIAISAFSLSFGAPFWFEMLNKMLRIRGGK